MRFGWKKVISPLFPVTNMSRTLAFEIFYYTIDENMSVGGLLLSFLVQEEGEFHLIIITATLDICT